MCVGGGTADDAESAHILFIRTCLEIFAAFIRCLKRLSEFYLNSNFTVNFDIENVCLYVCIIGETLIS